MTEGYEALRSGAAWFDLSSRGRIVARGRDRARLLHNLASNEVKKLTPGQGCYAFLLSPQGRIQADLNLLCMDDHFLIDTEPELREKVLQHIRRYIIADQVELEDVTAGTGSLGLEGPGAADILRALSAPVPASAWSHQSWGDTTVAAVSLTGQPGFRMYCASARVPELIGQFSKAGAKAATEEDTRIVRIENGRPRYGEDIRDSSLPQETGQMQAVSFTKGCYLGQEIVERIRAQGHVNKKLVRLRVAGDTPLDAGAKLTANGSAAGEITSSIYSPESNAIAAMAYVRSAFAEPGTELEVNGTTASVV